MNILLRISLLCALGLSIEAARPRDLRKVLLTSLSIDVNKDHGTTPPPSPKKPSDFCPTTPPSPKKKCFGLCPTTPPSPRKKLASCYFDSLESLDELSN